MIIGTRHFYEFFLDSRSGRRPKSVEAVKTRAVWPADDLFVLPEKKDGEFEVKVRRDIEETGELNLLWLPLDIDTQGQSFRPVDRRPHGRPDRTGQAPRVKPPNMWGKVASLWRAVKGPKVDDETFQDRLRQCTSVGGYTFSPAPCTVVYSDGRDIRVNTRLGHRDILIRLPEDEVAAVEAGDKLEEGQVIATGEKDKQCPHLRTEKDGSKMFCGACGCPKSRLGELKTKLQFANLTCPRKPPLFVPVTIESEESE